MIVELIQLHETTVRLVARIEEVELEELMALLETRDHLISKLIPHTSLTEEVKQVIRKICGYDQVIVSRMCSLKDEAAQELDRINKTRIQKKTYDQSYSSSSYFIDQIK